MDPERKLHMVSFDVPYPPDYGGVIDVFFKLKALAAEGVKVHLHCFQYGREIPPVLEKYATKVSYYPRKTGIFYSWKKKPYIVAGRNHPRLLENLFNMKAPILFEGLHTTYFISHPALVDYRKIIRLHNVEHEYYGKLAEAELNFFRQSYYKTEARKLKKYEPIISQADMVVTISPSDQQYFEQIHPNALWIPGFHNYETVKSKPGQGDYFLFHGNLNISENLKAVYFLLNEVISTSTAQFIIAGKNPPEKLLRKAAIFENVKIVANPGLEVMQKLIAEAAGCILPTFQATGLKLKLLASLYSGRYCIVNSPMVKNTGLENLCIVADTPDKINEAIDSCKKTPFTKDDILKRSVILGQSFSNKASAERLIKLIFQEK